MMTKTPIYLIVLLCLLVSFSSKSQTLKVRDKTTLSPLINLTIHSNNPKQYAITNLDGEADISHFKNADSIWFNHVSYKTKVLSFNELKGSNFILYFSEKLFSLDELVISASRTEEKLRDVA